MVPKWSEDGRSDSVSAWGFGLTGGQSCVEISSIQRMNRRAWTDDTMSCIASTSYIV